MMFSWYWLKMETAGAWTWSRFWTGLPFTFESVRASTIAAKHKDNGVRNVFITIWGDEGNECDMWVWISIYAKTTVIIMISCIIAFLLSQLFAIMQNMVTLIKMKLTFLFWSATLVCSKMIYARSIAILLTNDYRRYLWSKFWWLGVCFQGNIRWWYMFIVWLSKLI